MRAQNKRNLQYHSLRTNPFIAGRHDITSTIWRPVASVDAGSLRSRWPHRVPAGATVSPHRSSLRTADASVGRAAAQNAISQKVSLRLRDGCSVERLRRSKHSRLVRARTYVQGPDILACSFLAVASFWRCPAYPERPWDGAEFAPYRLRSDEVFHPRADRSLRDLIPFPFPVETSRRLLLVFVVDLGEFGIDNVFVS